MFHIIAVVLAVLATSAIFYGTAFANARLQRHQFEEHLKDKLSQRIARSPDVISTAPSPRPEDPAPRRKPARDPLEHRTPVPR
jgi:hypothetical protein